MRTAARRIAAFVAAHPLALLALVYVAGRCALLFVVEPWSFSDTGTYDRVASAPLLSPEFLAGWRPWSLPLLYKLVPGAEARVLAQSAISVASWIGLAAAVAEVMRGRILTVAAFGCVLGFSLSREVLQWDSLLLSESLSTSLTAAITAACLSLVHRPTPRTAVLLALLLVPWAFARDSHPYLLAIVAVPLAVSLGIRRQRRLRLGLLGLVSVLAVAAVASSSLGFDRGAYPLQTVIAQRIAADPQELEYFRQAGMPVDSRFLALARESRLATGADPLPHPGSDDPRLRAFHRWLFRHGRSTYIRYLVSHPHAAIRPLGDLRSILLHPRVERYRSPGSPAPLSPLADALYPRDPLRPVAYLAVAVLAALAAAARGGARWEWIVPLALIALSLPLGMFVWLADAREIDRHALLAGLSLRLGSLLLLLMAVDALLERRRR